MNNFTLPKLYDADGDLARQWYVYYTYKNPETGKNERFRQAISRALRTRAARYERAAELKKELKRKLLQGFNPFVFDDKRNTNCIDALEYVRKWKKATLKKRSGATYSSIIIKFENYLSRFGYAGRTIELVTRDVSAAYIDHIIFHEKLLNRSVNNHISFLRTVFNFLIKKEYININPFNYVEYLPQQDPEITAFTTAELQLINEKLPAHHYQLWVISQFIFYCFLRPQELVRLQFKDLLWEHRIITIPGEKSKNGKSEVIVIPERLIENLKNWNRNWPDHYYLFARGRNLTPAIRETAPTRISEAWRSFADKYGIEKNIYDMKHTGNGMAFDLGLNVRDIQLQNRHHSLEQTQQYLNKFRRQASDGFREKFSGF